ncbi:MAG: hypothetical protein HYW05_03535 [Candidatus Diapherotrites archaeon]|nr:hypothetical protein [Candidatus Diapherotrites archaeon]
MFSGVESNVEKIGVATQLVRRHEKIARMRGVDAIFCVIHNEKMESILRKEKWICLFSNKWIKFLK